MRMQTNKIKHIVDLNDFVELYNKSVGIICKEYIGKHLVIYDKEDAKEDMYDVVNSLSEIKEKHRVKELYIDGVVITDRKIFFPFDNIERIHGVPVLEITSMSNMFYFCKSLKDVGDLGEWDPRQITNMRGMFLGCVFLKDVGDLGEWDTSNVTNMGGMFDGCKSLTSVGDLGGWDTSNVTDMSNMFSGCESLTSVGDLGEWDTSKVTDMHCMFYGCIFLTHLGDLGGWDVSSVIHRYYMFWGCRSLTHNGVPVTSFHAYSV